MSAPAGERTIGTELPRESIERPPIAKARPLRPKRLALLGFGLLLTAGAAWYGVDWWQVGRFAVSTDDAYVGGNVTPIAPHVSGFIQQVLVTDNQFVRAGQPLIRLDPADFRAALDHAEAVVAERQAALANLKAQYELQQSTILEAEADLAARKASAAFAAEDAARYQSLARTEAGSRQDAQKAFATIQTAQAGVVRANAELAAAQQQLNVLDTQIAAAAASINQAMADRHTARLNLGYTVIDAPIDGYVGDRSAQVGAYVTTGSDLLSVVPATGLWVDANFKEDEIAHLRPGDQATIVADVLPGQVFRGRVLSLAPATGAIFSVIPPQNATGNFTKIVQRVPVRIAVEGEAATLGALRLGLSTTVAVDTRQVGDPAPSVAP